MITLSSKNYTVDAIRLSQLLSNTTKVNMLKVCKKFDLALQGKKGPSAKDLRKMAFMKNKHTTRHHVSTAFIQNTDAVNPLKIVGTLY